MKRIVVFVSILCFSFSLNVHAESVWDMAKSDNWGRKAGGMLGRGILNIVTSPVDMPVQMVRGASEKEPAFMGAVGGFATGAACTVLRAGSGVVDVVTSWIPDFHGLPVAKSYENCLDFEGEKYVAAAVPMYESKPASYPASTQTRRQPSPPKVVQQSTQPAPAIKSATRPSGATESGNMKYVKK